MAMLRPMAMRSIPACTGEPGLPCVQQKSKWVYPRVYGGTAGLSGIHLAPRGLSPRVRGNPVVVLLRASPARSIPACTGEPRPVLVPGYSVEVYPRVYGGTHNNHHQRQRPEGLSPRVRGNLQGTRKALSTERSIPACTGEPPRRSGHRDEQTVYPRVYGGTAGGTVYARNTGGLSPRVRGNRMVGRIARLHRRSIPACTGEPPRARHIAHRFSVYPRVYGGTRYSWLCGVCACGLSPRVRGNLSSSMGG